MTRAPVEIDRGQKSGGLSEQGLHVSAWREAGMHSEAFHLTAYLIAIITCGVKKNAEYAVRTWPETFTHFLQLCMPSLHTTFTTIW